MKTNILPPDSTLPAQPNEDAPLDRFLSRATTPRPHPDKVEGLSLGTLEMLDACGKARVGINCFSLTNIPAATLVALTPKDVGRAVALGFTHGDPQQPVILGFMLDAEPVSRSLRIDRSGERVMIEAQSELELRCGDAVILLQADGHIHLHGRYITSHAEAGQRIRGGSVQIN
ncbi:DUF6484 domain-containing protein [Parazoarcus communis]|nr:DUF6484 domain-containing protein [Parazoarcus communis]NMG72722.1 hypothetical protein [Parazoarcus communis SWub3 = DSM 12120]